MQPDSDVKSDVKLDTLSEPSVPLITENIVLPNDIFKSRFSYLLYELAHDKLVMVPFVIPVILVLIALNFRYDAVYIIAGIAGIYDIFGLVISLVHFMSPISDKGFKIKLLAEVIARKPAGEEWRTIAYNLNRYLFDNDLWNTPYYFYGGHNCDSYFQDLIGRARQAAQEKPSTKDADNTEPDTPPAQAPSDTPESHAYSSDPILEAYYLKAVEVEQQAQRNYWRSQYPDADMP
ncbi:hypothetical protein SUVZ_01G0760 [Saccharomyces uvarum]|uniref:Uncharacterized protein n=1 Tax=Saccharomyces uvarum TaxID=230603 RepID=A0ABN8WNC5_SACUV|nr:hypothetical protein SUVZ_01G0760 [Saccharomyces uvarum]